MIAFLRRNAGIPRLLQNHPITHLVDPTRAPVTRTSALRSRAYFRFPDFLRKTREYDFFPSSFSYPFSSSSSSVSKTGFVSWYVGMVKSRPVLTKSITSALIYTAADLTSQTIALPSTETFDFLRTLRMAGYGMLILGPSLHFWFNFMAKLFPKQDIFSTLKKMAMGQALYGPAMTVVFFSVNACLQGENITEIVARLKRDLLPTMLNGVMYWPVCDFITFRFTPVHLQPLVSNSFSYLWTIYMTYMASLEKASITTGRFTQ
ncbi:PXMP2/4 family protein 4-like [Juglans regia]|uniref:PXMP2/4 family protein 4-like n=1 Tax=Juglans regia TaxID=51240 RepID=A0A2I4H7J3_JUGRE|nr:PXMP2/4 family protein 4-like [Juglans regia]